MDAEGVVLGLVVCDEDEGLGLAFDGLFFAAGEVTPGCTLELTGFVLTVCPVAAAVRRPTRKRVAKDLIELLNKRRTLYGDNITKLPFARGALSSPYDRTGPGLV